MPWYLNGTLAETERQQVDEHVRVCAACRDQLARERDIYRAMSAESSLEFIPASFSRLQARLDALSPAEARAPEPAAHQSASEQGIPRRRRRHPLAATRGGVDRGPRARGAQSGLGGSMGVGPRRCRPNTERSRQRHPARRMKSSVPYSLRRSRSWSCRRFSTRRSCGSFPVLRKPGSIPWRPLRTAR